MPYQLFGDQSPNPEPKVALRCSFCGRPQDECQQLIGGSAVFICDECVDLAAEIVAKQRALLGG